MKPPARSLAFLCGVLLYVGLPAAAFGQSSCTSPANAIVAENCLPGTPQSQWDPGINGDDPSIVGFADDISVDVGQTINFKVNTNATAYTMDIYRMGYYSGMGARLVASITPSVPLPQTQPACTTDPNTNLVDCGNWAVTASWQVPTTATSGIYLVLLTRTDTQGQNLIVFIVRNDAGASHLLFQTSDETWQAYNEWQPSSDATPDPTTVGNSLYGPTGVFDITNRAYKVTYNRPFHTRDFAVESLSFVFGPEYAMVRWLEANGYDVSYFTSVDAARNGNLITNHQIYLSVGHDEYWSGPKRANVQAALAAGVNLAFFSGNEGFWKTRWENSIDGSSTPYRTLVCYKETYANEVIDPADPPTWTGTWRDPRFSPPADGGQPENALDGTIFMVNGPGSDNENLSIQVPQADGQMRFWRNTSIASLALGQTATLPAGTLGYEWDEDLDNGFRPAGLFDLATATYPLTSDLLLDYGETYGSGEAIHHITTYRASSGAVAETSGLVFGAGTVQWSFGLDSTHDDPLGLDVPTDIRMQQATVNLFADMGAQPATPQPGLVPATASTDTTAPTSTITSPTSGSTVQGGTLVTITGTAVDAGGGVVAGVEVSYDGGKRWHPATGRGNWSYVWGPHTPGTATLKSRAVDDSGNIETPGAGISVTVEGQTDMWSSTTTPQTVDSGDGNASELGVKFTSSQNGLLSGIRFYKSAANTGTHVGNLWRSDGTLLASAVFTDETASGWQQVNFSSPVAITAGTTYVASYYAPNGHYSDTAAFFANSGIVRAPLSFLANSVSPNGVYTYSPTSAFPTSSYDATNYWVDVVFYSSTVSAPLVITVSPANGATIVATGTSVTATFDELMNASTINTNSFQLSNPGGGEGSVFVPATVSYNSSTLTATLVPTEPLSYSTSYTAAMEGGANGVQDSNGNHLVSDYVWTFTTAPPPGTCPCSIWSYSTAPRTVDSGDGDAAELGVKFSSEEAGFITGIRFYKSMANAGMHVGNLWTTGGTLLASAIFTGETASGWQQVNFSSPVAVTANTTYVASYYAPVGHYSADAEFFATAGVDNRPLQALADGVSPDGVYTYGSASAFPSSSYDATNYWVDVVFNTTISASSGPTVTTVSPANAANSVSTGSSVTATFNESMNASTIDGNTFQLNSAGGTVAATVGYNSSALTATLVPTQPLAYSTTYTATVVGGSNGVQDPNGNVLSGNYVWTFTTASAPGTCPCSIWSSTTTPGTADSGDPNGVELGVTFTSSEAGFITGIRFYKSMANIGTHVGNLWTTGGTLLASAIFTGETASGWQQVNFSSPVAVTANTTYVASYYAPAGHYSADAEFFGTADVNNPPLQALANSVSPDGVYTYGSASAFPTSSYNATNYWVDVVFNTTISSPSGPTVSTVSPANGATSVSTGTSVSATFSESMNASTIDGNTFQLSSAGGTVAATVGYNSSTLTATLVPTQPLAYSTTYTATVVGGSNGVQDPNGNVLSGNYVWTFTTASAPGTCPCSIWSSSTTPGTADSGDPNGVELGVTFTSSEAGFITGIRFYKSMANIGTHVGNLWTTGGTLLASAIFSGETASGWQQVNFSSPVAVTADTTYVASYYAPAGHYSADAEFFGTADVNNPPLQALANGVSPDGVYTYGSASAFPTSTYNATNYWVDVVFNTTAPPPGTCPCSIWSSTTTPGTMDSGDPNGVELGVTFTSSEAGFITGIRFYKSRANTGTHVGNLWTTGGTLLASAIFSGETASGWQQVSFSSPVAVTADTTYVASYYAPAGHYSADAEFFGTAGVNNPPLQALANSVSPDGVYTYGSASAFPTSTYNATNYWVDVVFDTTAP